MKTTSVTNDPHFLGNVTITIEPKYEKRFTNCEVTVRYVGTPYEGKRVPYVWNVEILSLVEDPLEALEELKKDEYIDRGESETI